MTSALLSTSLENGASMCRAEFHRAYRECEDLEGIELIEGIVYLPSPIKLQGHAFEQTLAVEWLAAYAARHAGVRCTGPGTVLLDDQNEPQPDAMLFFERSDRYEDGYLLGAPELIVEIASTSASRDLHQKKRAYERAGVLEYIVWRTKDAAIDWFRLEDGAYMTVAPVAGRITSIVFPGLVLAVPAMLSHDRAGVLAAFA